MSSFMEKLLEPTQRFLRLEAASGLLLLAAAVFALVMANSPLHFFYESFIHWPLSFGLGGFELKMPLYHFVNDVLMVVFFFVVGLEIKRELVVGSLSSKKKAALPFMAALGGMIAPALIYTYFNIGQESLSGWAVPMATDIAFAVSVLTFLSKRVPFSLKIFLLALATIDDLGAVIVIASVYSDNISGFWLSLSGVLIAAVFCFKHLKVQSLIVYLLLGVLLWFFVYQSGVHATAAGVILGLITPVHPDRRKKDIQERLNLFMNETKPSTRQVIETTRLLRGIQSPAQMLIDSLHKWVSFFIMPVFAFFNSGLRFSGDFSFDGLILSPVFYGILFGLVVGKPLGVFLFCWASVRLKWAVYPAGVFASHIVGVGFLAGIGFTMALFLSHLSLAFDPELGVFSKFSIFLASIIAGLMGYLILRFFGTKGDDGSGVA